MKFIISIGIISIIFLLVSFTIFEFVFPKNDFASLSISVLTFFNFFDINYNKKNKNLTIKTINRLFGALNI